MSKLEPEHIRWVRYAADCAEHVVHLAGKFRPQAEAVITAVRRWADCPCYEHGRETFGVAVDVIRAAVCDTKSAKWAAGAAIDAARSAVDAAWIASRSSIKTGARLAAYAAAWAATDAARAATGAAIGAVARTAYEAERSWQAGRRKHYGLE